MSKPDRLNEEDRLRLGLVLEREARQQAEARATAAEKALLIERMCRTYDIDLSADTVDASSGAITRAPRE